MAFTATACKNSSDGSCDESLLIKASEKNRKNVGGPAQVVVNSIYFLIFIHIKNSVALNEKITLFF